MRNTRSIIIALSIAAMLAGCGGVPTKQPLAATPEETISGMPAWYLKQPDSTADVIYVAGTAISRDMAMSDSKAQMDAETKLAFKIAGEVSAMQKDYRRDNGDDVDASAEIVANKLAADINIGGAAVAERKMIAEGAGYRTYILLKFSVADYNKMLKTAAATRTFRADKAAAEQELDQRVAAKKAESATQP